MDLVPQTHKLHHCSPDSQREETALPGNLWGPSRACVFCLIGGLITLPTYIIRTPSHRQVEPPNTQTTHQPRFTVGLDGVTVESLVF